MSSSDTFHGNLVIPYDISAAAGASAYTFYDVNIIRQAYNVFPIPPMSGAKQVVIGIVIAYSYSNLQSDFTTFCGRYLAAYPSSTLEIIQQSNSVPSANGTGWDIEICIDTQLSYSMNPYAHIRVYEANSNSNADLYTGVQYLSNDANFIDNSYGTTDLITLSWGSNEGAGETAYASFFSNQHIVYSASTGDANYASFPALCPNVLGVGATDLYYGSGSRYELPWNLSGCGVSRYIAKPTYQDISNLTAYANRTIPDLVCIGGASTPVLFYITQYGFVGESGTSLSSPLVAGMLSNLVQQQTNMSPSAPHFTTVFPATGNSIQLQTLLYNLYDNSATSPFYIQSFYDISSGTDAGNGTIRGSTHTGGYTNYTVAPGFDIASGLGSLNVGTMGSNNFLYHAINAANVSCFNRDTEILCGDGLYRPIQDLVVGQGIQTFRHGVKPIAAIRSGVYKNNPLWNEAMYVMKREREPRLTQDLYVTGGHSLLVEELTEDQRLEYRLRNVWDTGEPIQIDGLYLLLAAMDPRFEKIQDDHVYYTYHLALQGETPDQRFAIWANGLLTETLSKDMTE